jgi:membrane protease YdiL (CAAX protease family)
VTVLAHDDASAPRTRWFTRAQYPSAIWACVELLLALAIIAAGLTVQSLLFIFGSTPWLVAAAMLFLWWRGPGWRAIGLRRPASLTRTLALGVGVGVGYQLLGTFLVEPLVARLTSGTLPDVSQFRSLIGNKMQLAYWLAISWTLAAILEELSFRGWLMTRFAEVGHFDRRWWLVSVIATSVLFGVVHAYQSLSGIVATGLTGLLFGGLYLATGRNLWACIIAHGVLDATGFVMMYFDVYPGL